MVLSAKQNSRELDFSSDPLVPDKTGTALSYTRYIAADSDHYLTGLEIDIRYRADDRVPYIAILVGVESNLILMIAQTKLSRTATQ